MTMCYTFSSHFFRWSSLQPVEMCWNSVLSFFLFFLLLLLAVCRSYSILAFIVLFFFFLSTQSFFSFFPLSELVFLFSPNKTIQRVLRKVEEEEKDLRQTTTINWKTNFSTHSFLFVFLCTISGFWKVFSFAGVIDLSSRIA